MHRILYLVEVNVIPFAGVPRKLSWAKGTIESLQLLWCDSDAVLGGYISSIEDRVRKKYVPEREHVFVNYWLSTAFFAN